MRKLLMSARFAGWPRQLKRNLLLVPFICSIRYRVQYKARSVNRYARDAWVIDWGYQFTVDRSPRPFDPVYWRRRVQKLFLRQCTIIPGDIIIDVGAGNGTELVEFASRVGPAGAVIAIEGHPESAYRLRLAVQLNGLGNVTPIGVAVTDRAGIVTFATSEGSHSSALTRDGLLAVPALPLDDVMRDYPGSVGLLKINVEGSEVDVLRGATATLARTRNVCVSCHDFKADADELTLRDQVQRILVDSGFALMEGIQDGTAWEMSYVYASR